MGWPFWGGHFRYCVERDQYLGVAGRGGWHDPDQLLVGQTDCPAAEKKFTPTSTGMYCNPITHDEEQLQMALWAMSHAPLFISNHVPSIPASSSSILLNKAVLAINSDPLGRMPFRYGAFWADVHHFDRIELDLCGGIHMCGALPSPVLA